MQQLDNPGDPSSQWIIREADGDQAPHDDDQAFDPTRRYLIENKNARGKYLNVAGASQASGAELDVRCA